MDNFNDMQQIWLSANVTALPTAGDILRTIKKYRLRQIFKVTGVILLVLLMIITMIHVVFDYHSRFLSTRIGEACIFTAIFILLSVNIRSLRRISASNIYSNIEFLNYLKNEKLMLFRFQQITQKIGFAFGAAGLMLFIFEVVYQPLSLLIASYSGVILWCCFSWFVIRPVAMRRKTKKIDEAILKLEQFSRQLENQTN